MNKSLIKNKGHPHSSKCPFLIVGPQTLWTLLYRVPQLRGESRESICFYKQAHYWRLYYEEDSDNNTTIGSIILHMQRSL